MRVVLVTESFYPSVDDTTTTVRHVLDRLIDTGHQVLVIAPAPGLTSYRGVPVARITTPAKGADRGARVTRGSQVRQALAEFRPDLVQVHSPGQLGRRALKHAVRLGLPRLTVQHEPVAGPAVDRWLHRVARRSDRVLVTSTWAATTLREHGVAVHVWEPGVDAQAFTPAVRDEHLHRAWARVPGSTGGTDPAALVVGYAGPLRRRHGVRRLAELAAHDDLNPVVIGSGPQQGGLRMRMPATRFVGAGSTGELATAVASLDVLVHPGTQESDCHALRQAAASRVPVVVPAAGGAADVVGHRVTGLHYDPDESGALLAAVRELGADPLLRVRLGVQARARAQHRTWVEAVDELLDQHHPAICGAAPRPLTA